MYNKTPLLRPTLGINEKGL